MIFREKVSLPRPTGVAGTRRPSGAPGGTLFDN